MFFEPHEQNFFIAQLNRHFEFWFNHFSSRNWNLFFLPSNIGLICVDVPLGLYMFEEVNDKTYDEPIAVPLSKDILLTFGGKGNKIFKKLLSDSKIIRDINKQTFDSAERFVASHNKKLLEEFVNN